MPFFPVFLSVAVVVRNQSAQLEQLLTEVASGISSLVSNYDSLLSTMRRTMTVWRCSSA